MKNQRQLLAVAVLLSLGTPWAQSQTAFTDVTVSNTLKVETSSNPATGNHLELRSNGILIQKGDSAVTLLSSDTNKSGFLWHSGKSALSAGYIRTEAEIGYLSASFAYGSAPGYFSFAANQALAEGEGSFAAGAAATGPVAYYSVGLNYGSALAEGSTALNEALAQGYGSTGLNGGWARGYYSTAMGFGQAGAYASLAIGRYNVGSFTAPVNNNIYTGGDLSWVATDPVFEIGNGTYQTPSNALTVYKNGKTELGGKLTLSNGGGSTATPVIVLDPATANITINGTPLLKANSSGNFGIGTTNPTNSLDVLNGSYLQATFRSSTSAGGVALKNYGGYQYEMQSDPGNRFTIFDRNANAYRFNVQPSGNVTVGTITDLGSTFGVQGTGYFSSNVGIGTTTPVEKLDVIGNINLATTTSSVGQLKFGGIPVLHTYGVNNLFAGPGVGNFTTTGTGNLGIGSNNLNYLTSGGGNVAVGDLANRLVSSGGSNVGIGYGANYSISTGGWNVGIGNAANFTTNGYRNTAIGTSAGPTGGSFNVSIGNGAGNVANSGDGNVFIGSSSGITGGSAFTNATAIGYNALVGASNAIVLGGTGSYAVSVGIGTTVPTEKLQVVGNIRASGVIRCAAGGDISMGSFVAGTPP